MRKKTGGTDLVAMCGRAAALSKDAYAIGQYVGTIGHLSAAIVEEISMHPNMWCVRDHVRRAREETAKFLDVLKNVESSAEYEDEAPE